MKEIAGSPPLRLGSELAYLVKLEGDRVNFTRSERYALQLLTASPGRLVTREEILDAVSEPGSDKSDRNVDFLINRLRRKLEDDARNPRYIATRYGEGYVWIGGPLLVEPDVAGADLVITDIRGLDVLGEDSATGEAFLADMVRAFRAALGDGKSVVHAPDCPPAEKLGALAPRHSVELVFFKDRGRISCITSVRDFRSRQPVGAHRLGIEEIRAGRATADRLARRLCDEMWRGTITAPVQNVPLPIALYSASVGDYVPHHGDVDVSNRKLLSLFENAELRTLRTWLANERRLRSMLDENPGDAEVKLLLAVAIHSKYVMAGQLLLMQGIDTRDRDEDAIETLITDALPYIRSDPSHAIVAGKLLHFLRRGYDDLGRDLCEDAYARSVSVASSLVIVGQMRAFFGETDIGLESIEQALRLSRPGSHAHAHALILKGQALASAGRWDELRSVRKELRGASAIAGLVLSPLLDNPERQSVTAKSMMYLFSRRRTEATLANSHYISGRLFRDPSQGANAMLSFARHAVRRFGPDIVPQDITRALPELAERLS